MINKNKILGIVIGVVAVVLIALSGMLFEDADNFANGECCYAKVKNNTCDLHVFASALNCPMDCPRLDTKEHACDKGKCKRVKAIIANLKVQVK